jgi:hypothetical protein
MPQPCPIHGTLHLDGYAIRTAGFLGTQVFDYFETKRTRFPHANAVSFGSCTARNAGARKKVKYCPDCRRELLTWCHEKRPPHNEVSPFVESIVAHLSAAREA